MISDAHMTLKRPIVCALFTLPRRHPSEDVVVNIKTSKSPENWPLTQS